MINVRFSKRPGNSNADSSESASTVSVPRVLVANKSGVYVPLGGILGIDGPPTPYDPSTSDVAKVRFLIPSQVVLAGVTPTVADHLGKWVVPLQQLPPNYHYECKAAGIARVRVYVNGADDAYCDVIDAETVGEDEEAETCYLGTGASGAQILWRQNEGSGVGTIVWAIVRIGHRPKEIIRCRLAEALYDCGDAEAVVLSASTPDDPPCEEGATITVTSPLGVVAGSMLAELDDLDEWFVPAGTAVYVRRFGDTAKYEALAFGSNACCEALSESESSSSESSESESEESESESESPSSCRDQIGRYKLSDIPGYDGGTRQYLAHDADGCLEWVTPGVCDEDEGSES